MYWFILMLISPVILIHRSRKLPDDRKKGVKYFFIGCSIFIFSSVIGNLVLPIIYANQAFTGLGPGLSIIWLSLLWLSITKTKFMNIRLAVTKTISLVIVGVLISIASLFGLILTSNFPKLQFPLFILLGLGLTIYGNKIRLFIQTTTEKAFIKGWYDYKEVLMTFTEALGICSSLRELVTRISELFRSELEVFDNKFFFPAHYDSQRTTDAVFTEWEIDSTNIDHSTDTPIVIATQRELDHSVKNIVLERKDIVIAHNENKVIKDRLRSLGIEVLIPCFSDDEGLIMIISLGKKSSEDPYSLDDSALFKTLGIQITETIIRINKTLSSAELDVAHKMQGEIFPDTTVLPGYEIAHFAQPADKMGGDYYDIFERNNESWMVMGDVTGHGVSAGIVMFMVQSIVSTILDMHPKITPGDLNGILNRVLHTNVERLEDPRNLTMVTACMKKTGNIILSGGHDNIYIYRTLSKSVEVIEVNQMPFDFGLMDELSDEMMENVSYKLNKGDLIFIGTDGITEAYKNGNSNEIMYGEERLLQFILQNSNKALDEFKTALIKEMDHFTDGVYFDDVTFFVAKFK
jgi:hypothetical protein